MADLKTVLVKNVELMAAGTWQGHNCPEGGCKFTEADIDEMVRAYEETKGEFDAPVKLGHNDSQKLLQNDGYPAAGWVVNLRRVGNKLVGDLKDVPVRIAELMKVNAYKKRSSEIRPDAEINGKKYKWVFSGLALLGADLPAVEGLADIEKLYASLRLEKAEGANIFFFEEKPPEEPEEEDPVDAVMRKLDELVSEAESLIRGQRGAPKLRHLVQAAKEELRRVAKNPSLKEKKNMTIDEKALRELLGLGDEDDVMAAVNKLKNPEQNSNPNTNEPPAENAALAKLQKDLSEAQAQILSFQTESVKAKAEAAVEKAITDGKILPSQKETSLSFAIRDMEGFTKFVESQPKLLEFGERGSTSGGSGNGFNAADYEPTPVEISQAKELGTYSEDWRFSIIRTKAAAAGVSVPLDFGKKKEEAKA